MESEDPQSQQILNQEINELNEAHHISSTHGREAVHYTHIYGEDCLALKYTAMNSTPESPDLASLIRDSQGRSITPHSTVSSRRQIRKISVDDLPYVSEQTRRLQSRGSHGSSTSESPNRRPSAVSQQRARTAEGSLPRLSNKHNTYPTQLLRKFSQDKLSRTQVKSVSKTYLNRTSPAFKHSTEMKTFQAFLSYLNNPESDSEEDGTNHEITNVDGGVDNTLPNSPSSQRPDTKVNQPHMAQDTIDAAGLKTHRSLKKRNVLQFPAYVPTDSSSDDDEVDNNGGEGHQVPVKGKHPSAEIEQEESNHFIKNDELEKKTLMSNLQESEKKTDDGEQAAEQDTQFTESKPTVEKTVKGHETAKNNKSAEAVEVEENEKIQDGRQLDANEEQNLLMAKESQRDQKTTPVAESSSETEEITPRHSQLSVEPDCHSEQGESHSHSKVDSEVNDVEYSDDFAALEDTDSGRGTRQDFHSKGSDDDMPPVGSKKVVAIKKVRTKRKSKNKDHKKLHYSLIDTPYMDVPLKNIYSRKVQKELGKQSKRGDVEKPTEPMHCYMCGNMTDNINHAIRANLRYNKVSRASTGNSSFYFVSK